MIVWNEVECFMANGYVSCFYLYDICSKQYSYCMNIALNMSFCFTISSQLFLEWRNSIFMYCTVFIKFSKKWYSRFVSIHSTIIARKKLVSKLTYFVQGWKNLGFWKLFRFLRFFTCEKHICYSTYMLWQFRLSVRHTGGSVKNGWS